MGCFDPIELSWAGKSYKIPADHVLEAVCEVEEVFTLQEMSQYAIKGVVPAGKMSKAFGRLIRYAGAPVTDEEVYTAMFNRATAEFVGLSLRTMLMMLLPKETTRQGSAPSGNVSGVAGKSSKKRTRRH